MNVVEQAREKFINQLNQAKAYNAGIPRLDTNTGNLEVDAISEELNNIITEMPIITLQQFDNVINLIQTKTSWSIVPSDETDVILGIKDSENPLLFLKYTSFCHLNDFLNKKIP